MDIEFVWGDEMVLKLDWVAQLCECIKINWTTHLKCMVYIIFELYFYKAATKWRWHS